MTLDKFKSSLSRDEVPPGLSIELVSLWHDGKGDWNMSHEVIQDINSKNAAWIHAYLHRKEGDRGNAQYWYSRANKTMPEMSLDEEWNVLVKHFLSQ